MPRIAVTGAISASLGTMSGLPMSPAWMMCSTPSSAYNASGRSRPWVSEITPISIVASNTGSRHGASGFNVVPYVVALHRKLAFPFVTLIMALIAVPFAVTTGKHGAMYGVGAGIVLAILYWTAISVFGAIGAGGLMAPALAAWAPNIIFGCCAMYLLLTVRT